MLSGALLTSLRIPIGLLGNPITVFHVGYWKIQLVFMENRSWGIESGWTWSEGSTTGKDTCVETCGDGVNAAVKDVVAIVLLEIIIINYYTILHILSF